MLLVLLFEPLVNVSKNDLALFVVEVLVTLPFALDNCANAFVRSITLRLTVGAPDNDCISPTSAVDN